MTLPVKDPDTDSTQAGVAPLPFFHAHRRLVLCGLLFVAAAVGLWRAGLAPSRAGLLGFDLAALVFLLLTGAAFGRATPATMRIRAQQVGGLEGAADLIAAAASIVLSWLYMNMIFALHYAHGYYSHRNGMHKGLDFPGKEDPDYWDFAYFSLVLGMTFQVSDVQIVSRRLRRTALLHCVIAFFFNVFIIAISVNVAAGRA